MKRYLFLITLAIMPMAVDAAVDNNVALGSSFGAMYATGDTVIPGTEGMDERQIIATLRQDIQVLDQEIAQCERKRKGWVAATIVGGVGVVGTGIAAIVQGNNLHDTKSELQDVKNEILKMDKK